MPLGVISPHSPSAQIIAGLFSHLLILLAAVFALVAGLVGYAVIRYRGRAGQAEPAQTFGSRRLEILWTVVPLAIVIVLFALTVSAMARIDAPSDPDRAADLVVTGHQWWWDARYPNGAVAVTEIHIPVGKRLLVRVESTDVIHDFWVPQLARKMDAVPGHPGYIWLEADAPGTYAGQCSEFCGAQHAWMHFYVVAESATDYAVWLRRQAEPARELPPPIYTQKCAECHSDPARGPRFDACGEPPISSAAAYRRIRRRISRSGRPGRSREAGQSHAGPAIVAGGSGRADGLPRESAVIGRTDHKSVGMLYMISALLFSIAGGAEAMVMRAQLSLPNLKLVTPQLYNQIFTMHGTTMIFLVVMPVLIGFGVYLVPLMIGAKRHGVPASECHGFLAAGRRRACCFI